MFSLWLCVCRLRIVCIQGAPVPTFWVDTKLKINNSHRKWVISYHESSCPLFIPKQDSWPESQCKLRLIYSLPVMPLFPPRWWARSAMSPWPMWGIYKQLMIAWYVQHDNVSKSVSCTLCPFDLCPVMRTDFAVLPSCVHGMHGISVSCSWSWSAHSNMYEDVKFKNYVCM